MTNRFRHALVGDTNQPLENLLIASGLFRAEIGAKLPQADLGRLAIDGDREPRSHQPPEQQIDIGDGERTACAIRCRSGVGAGTLRSDRQPALFDSTDGPATGGDGLDGEGRSGELHRTHPVVEDVLEITIETRDIGARPTHVERDHPVRTGLPTRHRGADNASRRTAQEAVHCPETGSVLTNPPALVMTCRETASSPSPSRTAPR